MNGCETVTAKTGGTLFAIDISSSNTVRRIEFNTGVNYVIRHAGPEDTIVLYSMSVTSPVTVDFLHKVFITEERLSDMPSDIGGGGFDDVLWEYVDYNDISHVTVLTNGIPVMKNSLNAKVTAVINKFYYDTCEDRIKNLPHQLDRIIFI